MTRVRTKTDLASFSLDSLLIVLTLLITKHDIDKFETYDDLQDFAKKYVSDPETT